MKDSQNNTLRLINTFAKPGRAPIMRPFMEIHGYF